MGRRRLTGAPLDGGVRRWWRATAKNVLTGGSPRVRTAVLAEHQAIVV
jgi:hypothetical protein